MTPQPLVVQCPSCGSSDITYTCEPKCCFNHICATCYTTFELFTEPLGQVLTGIEKSPQERDSLAPTVACARCGSLEIYMVEPGGGAPSTLVCAECQGLLRLGFAAVESH
jgi:DNA-directed RNA polymerase subunit RPC12/RpoP